MLAREPQVLEGRVLVFREAGCDKPDVRRIVTALLLIAWLRASVSADPETPDSSLHDPVAAPRASLHTSPWIDLSPSTVLEHDADQPREDHKVASLITLGGAYVGFTTWTYLAWYRKHKPLSQFKWGGDGWLGDTTYAGGADKFGHAWATMSLARGGTELLNQWGGFDRIPAAAISTGLAELLFIGVEVKDGFYYEFSFSDATGDTLGAIAAFALSVWPRLDELFDYRVQYFPSQMYLRKVDGSSPCPVGGCSRWNIAEDYSGETYLLAFHLGGIHALRDMKYGVWTRFVDLAVGFDTRNYKPTPDAELNLTPRQQLFVGVSLNAQGLFDYLLEGRPSRPARVTRKITHGMFEIFNLPFTTLRGPEYSHVPNGTPATDGA
jgi:hypothetical protein